MAKKKKVIGIVVAIVFVLMIWNMVATAWRANKTAKEGGGKGSFWQYLVVTFVNNISPGNGSPAVVNGNTGKIDWQ